MLNALQAGRRTRMYRIYVLATLDLAARKDAGAVKQLLAAAKEQGIPTVSARGCIMVKDPMKLRVIQVTCQALRQCMYALLWCCGAKISYTCAQLSYVTFKLHMCPSHPQVHVTRHELNTLSNDRPHQVRAHESWEISIIRGLL